MARSSKSVRANPCWSTHVYTVAPLPTTLQNCNLTLPSKSAYPILYSIPSEAMESSWYDRVPSSVPLVLQTPCVDRTPYSWCGSGVNNAQKQIEHCDECIDRQEEATLSRNNGQQHGLFQCQMMERQRHDSKEDVCIILSENKGYKRKADL